MKYLRVALLPLSALLQSTLPHPFLLFLPPPDLVLLLVVGAAASSGVLGALPWAIAGGMMLDVLSALPFGAHAIGLAAVIPLVVIPGTMLVVTQPLLLVVVEAFLATWLYHGILWAALGALGGSGDWLPLVPATVLPIATLNALLMPLVYGFWGWARPAPGE